MMKSEELLELELRGGSGAAENWGCVGEEQHLKMSIWNISCRRLRTTEWASGQWLFASGVATPGPIQAQALVNFWVPWWIMWIKSTEPVYRIMSHRIKLPMSLTYGFSFFACQLQQQIWDPGVSYAVSKFTIQLRSKFTLLIMKRQYTLFDNVSSLSTLKVPTSAQIVT